MIELPGPHMPVGPEDATVKVNFHYEGEGGRYAACDGLFDQTVFNKTLLATTGDMDITWVNNAKIMCYPRLTKNRNQTYLAGWGKTAIPGLKPAWQYDCPNSKAAAICKNAVLVATQTQLIALNLKDGKTIWAHNLPASRPVLWGMAVDRNGKIILTLKNGQVLCFGK